MLLKSLPRLARPHAARELSVWALLAVPTGVLSGGVTGVLVQTVFGKDAPTWVVAVAVALMTGAGSIANMGSLFWAHWGLGRRKVPALNQLQAGLAAVLLAAAVAPIGTAGLGVFVLAILSAQILWTGIITIRASIWRLAYDRASRFAFAADNQAIVATLQAGTAALTGWLVQAHIDWFRWLLAATSVLVILSLLRSRTLRLRHERRLLATERQQAENERFRIGRYLSILRDDALFRRYMGCMMLQGSGNLMFTAPLILAMTRELGMNTFSQVLVTTVLPTLVVPFSSRYWARILARVHVISFRRLNSRWFTLAIALTIVGALAGREPLLWLSALVYGIATGGGMLGWNLGHNDFAPEERAADYLGLNISLTGLRGLLAPLIGVWVYGLLETLSPGTGPWSLFLPLALTVAGSIAFARFDRDIRKGGYGSLDGRAA
jgi:hypothetical protein